jgi:hypothetical protein
MIAKNFGQKVLLDGIILQGNVQVLGDSFRRDLIPLSGEIFALIFNSQFISLFICFYQ